MGEIPDPEKSNKFQDIGTPPNNENRTLNCAAQFLSLSLLIRAEQNVDFYILHNVRINCSGH